MQWCDGLPMRLRVHRKVRVLVSDLEYEPLTIDAA